MKKIALLTIVACLGLFAVSCKNQPKEEATPAETTVEEVVDAATEVSEEAAATVKEALDDAAEAVKDAAEAVKDAAEQAADEIKK